MVVVTRRVRPSRLLGRVRTCLERERRAWLAIPERELPVEPGWRAGYCEGLRKAQLIARDGG
ncbi:hypothetical protein GCM10027521_14380 [Amycolatopsis cihanbeyliensis]